MEKFTALSLEQYLEELSSNKPIPGGGSVSAYVASLGMGLTQMVIGVAMKRKPKADAGPDVEAEENLKRETLQKIYESLEISKKKAFELVDLDPQIFQELTEVWGDSQKLEPALEKSYRVQADLCELLIESKIHNSNVVKLVKGSIKNDLIVSSALLKSAFVGAFHTAQINVVYMKDQEIKGVAEKALEDIKSRMEKGQADAS